MTQSISPLIEKIKMPARVKVAVKTHAQKAGELREVERLLSVKRLELAEVEKRLAILREAILPITRQLWCADLTETGAGDVATLEVPGEAQYQLIAPGCPPPSISAYGRVEGRATLDPNQAYWNAAALPGVQKWRPDYRIGMIESIDYVADQATVLLDDARSSADALPINQTMRLVDIPVVYMSCHAAAFSVGDRVLVAFHERKWENAYVAGFERQPKACTKPWLIIWSNSYWSWYWQYPTPDTGDMGFSKPFDESGVGTSFFPQRWANSSLVVDYDRPQFAVLGLDNLGKWRTWPWLNEKLFLNGAGLRPGTHTQRVYLNGKRRLLQFSLTEQWNVHARMEQERRNSAWSYVNWEFNDQAVITLGGKPFALGPETGIFVPDHYEWGRLCGVSVFMDRFGVQWIVAVVYVKTLATAGFYVFSRPLNASAWHLLLKDEYPLSTAWIGRACQQWRFKVDGSQAALVANNGVRLLDVHSGPSDGAPPAVSFSWHPSYSYAPLRLDHQFWYPESGPLLLFGSADYDAKTQALRVSYADGAGGVNFMVWVDNRYGIELRWTDGRYGLFEFSGPGAQPVVWDIGGGLPYRLGFIQFDGRNGVAGFYLAHGQNTAEGAGLDWKVYRFNSAGGLRDESWAAAPPQFRGMTNAWPMAVGTTEDGWR